MKTKLLIVLAAFLLFNCDNNDDQIEVPRCLQSNINFILTSSPIIPRDKIKKYSFNGEDVYLIETFIPDVPSVVTKLNCEIICEFGGVIGVETCQDFYDNAIFKEIVWTDPR